MPNRHRDIPSSMVSCPDVGGPTEPIGRMANGIRYAILAVYLLVWLAWFGPVIWGQQLFFFRDAVSWHLPALSWTTQIHGPHASGWPLWNDQIGLGVNWAGQGTSTVFYPPSWLLAIPCGSIMSRYGLLLGLHVLLAGANAYLAATRCGCRRDAAMLAALAYSFSGPVLIQHANWPFLVSASWLPLAVAGLSGIITRPATNCRMAITGLSLMVLGGDPQTAYTLIVLGFVVAIAVSLFRGQRPIASSLRWIVGQWALVAVVMVLLSFVQLAASLDQSRTSSRVLTQPKAELMASDKQDFHMPELGHDPRWDLRFSQAPWTMATMVSGNVLGTWRDYNRRWDSVLPAADSPWSPSLYLGVIPLALAIATFRFRQGLIRNSPQLAMRLRWLQVMALLAAGISFGWYGLGWLLYEMRLISLSPTAGWRPETGGLYWVMTKCLPGYDQFRYPGKLWQITNLSVCLLAAMQWQYLLDRPKPRRVHPVLWWLLAFFLLVTLGFSFTIHPTSYRLLGNWLQPRSVDPWLGILRPEMAISEIQMALFQSLVVAGLGWWLLVSMYRRRRGTVSTALPCPARMPWSGLLLLIVLIDLAVANSWLMMTTDRSCIEFAATQNHKAQYSRRYFDSLALDRHRLLEMQRKWGRDWVGRPVGKLAWQALRSMVATDCPHSHLWSGNGVVNSDATLRPAYRDAVDLIVRKNLSRIDDPKEFRDLQDCYLSRLGVEQWQDSGGVLPPRANDKTTQLRLRRVAQPQSPVWFARSWEIRPSPAKTWVGYLEDAEAVWWKAVKEDRPQAHVILNRSLSDPNVTQRTSNDAPPEPTQWDFHRKSARLTLKQPALMCWNFGYDPGWQCELIREDGTQIQRPAIAINRMQTGVLVPSGRYHLQWYYRPWWWRWGAPVTLIAWAAFLGIWVRQTFQRSAR